MAHRKSYKHQTSQKTQQGNLLDWYCNIPEESEDEEEQEILLQPDAKPVQEAEQQSAEAEENKTNPIYCTEKNKQKRKTQQEAEELGSQDAQNVPPGRKPSRETRKKGIGEKYYGRTRTNEKKQPHLEINTSRQTTTDTMSDDEDIEEITTATAAAPRSKKHPAKNETPINKWKKREDKNKPTMNQTH